MKKITKCLHPWIATGIFLAGLLCIPSRSYSQLTQPEMPSIVSPSPTVASLMHFEEVPVDNYTGQPGISIPLLSKALGSGITLPISLNYNTLGLRLQERSGWNGTCWALDAGGVISRTIRGIADEEKKPQYYTPEKIGTGIYHLPGFWNYDALTTAQRNEFNWNANGTTRDRYDYEFDLYQFSLPGLSGRFYVKLDGNMLTPVILSRDQKIKIEVFADSDYKIHKFIVTDASGNKFTLDAVEETTTLTSTISEQFWNSNPISPDELNPSSTNNTAWHLTEIRGNQDQILATFHYNNSEENYDAAPNVTRREITNPSVTTSYDDNEYNKAVLKPRFSISYNKIKVQTKKLSSVIFKDGTKVVFTTSQQGSHPETDGIYLAGMKYLKTDGATALREFAFTYDVTTTNQRLWLTNVSENGLNHQIDYVDKGNLPAFDERGEFSDDWGYSKTWYPGYRSPGVYNTYQPANLMKGTLSRIVFPTGGAKDFIWEPHTYAFNGSVALTNFDSNPANLSAQTIERRFKAYPGVTKLLTNNDQTESTVPTTPFTIDFAQYVYATLKAPFSCPLSNHIFYSLRIYKVVGSTQTNAGTIALKDFFTQQETFRIYLEPGQYYYTLVNSFQNPGSTPDPNCPGVPDSNFITGIRLHFLSRDLMSYQSAMTGGGLRIKQILFKERPNTMAFTRKVNYSYQEFDPELDYSFGEAGISSGVTDSRADNLLKEYSQADKVSLFTSVENVSGQISPVSIVYKVFTKEVNAELSKGNYIAYRHVKVSEDLNGYTRFRYKTAREHPSPPGTFTYPFQPSLNVDYLRGLLEETRIFNAQHQPLVEEINNYNHIEEIVGKLKTLAETPCGWRQFYDTYTQFVAKTPDAERLVFCGGQYGCFGLGGYQNCSSPYYFLQDDLKAGWAQLTSTSKREFFYEGMTENSILTTSSFMYNTDNYQVKESVRNINGVEHKTVTEYIVGGFTSALFTGAELSAISAMLPKNMVNTPVTMTYFRDGVQIERIINKYYDTGLLKEIETSKGAAAPEDRITYLSYDADGNPTEISKAGGRPITYIWGHNGTLPVAQFENATLPQVNALVPPSLFAEDYEPLRANPAFSGVYMTTYYHTPGVGIDMIRDPRGYTTRYFYDAFQRLLYATDHQQNIISTNDYHYRPN